MRPRRTDLRYLMAKDKSLEYAYLAIGDRFASRDEFFRFYESIQPDRRKNLFLRTASFYLFLVKRGDWIVDIPGSGRKIDYLTNTYKYVGVFSLIESLLGEDFIDFYQYLVRRGSAVSFPITDKPALERLYRCYKSEFGSIQRCISFFRALDPVQQKDLISKLKVQGVHPSIENLAKLLYDLRSKFVHKSELAHHMTDGTSMSSRGRNVAICTLSIDDAFNFFEEGLIAHFQSGPTMSEENIADVEASG
jgi:hypothetical protein